MFNQNTVTRLKIQRSYKKIAPTVTTTFNAGDLVPFFNMEIIPNDRISLDIETVTNMTTPNFATMDTLYQHIAFFYCPNRLVWENWDKFYGDGKNASYTTFVQKYVPQLSCPSGGWAEHTVADYLGVTTKKACHSINALVTRMFAMIYNEYYRDEQRQAPALISTGDSNQTGTNGNNTVNDLQNGGIVPKACRLYDYFTGTKLEFQAGAPTTIPIGTTAPVAGTGMGLGLTDGTNKSGLAMWTSSAVTALTERADAYGQQTGSTATYNPSWSDKKVVGVTTDITKSGLYADLSNAQGITVREFKKVLMAQQVLQNLEDGGTRYIEQLNKRWGVNANELELEIPKFLGAKTTILNMAMVVGTGAKPTSGTTDYEFGQLTGMSNTYDNGAVFTYHFKQHGYLFGIVTIRPFNTYENGINKSLVKQSIDDYYKPEMAYLGPDIVRNYEIYSDSSDGLDDAMFGVRNYGDELRYIPNKVTGQMRTNATYSQAYKTYSINYATRPTNGDTFIKQSQAQVDKTLTTTSSTMDQFVFQAKLIIKMTRNLPKNPQAEQLIRL